MAKETDLIKTGTIRRYLKDVLKLRMSKGALKEFQSRLNDVAKTILKEAASSTKTGKRTTVMPRDMSFAIESNLGEKNLSPDDIVKGVRRLTAIDLGALSRDLNNYIDEEKAKR